VCHSEIYGPCGGAEQGVHFILAKKNVAGKPGNKLRTYATFKESFTYENYLDYNVDFRRRRLITKLRISAHRLEMEMGRYHSSRIKPENRICKFCDMHVPEDENNFLMTCPKYTPYRNEMFKELIEAFYGFDSLDQEEKLILLMSCKDYEIFESLTKMLERAEGVRGTL
jgi:hypothetical protein